MFHNKKEMKLHTYFIKNYKKNTLAIFLSFTLTFMLLTSMLVLIHTNHKISNIQLKEEFTPSDCRIVDLSMQQVKMLQNDSEIKWMALQQGSYATYERNGQVVFFTRTDNASITMMAKLVDGKLPQKKGEIVAEKWVLLNLGIEPVIGQNVTITDIESGQEKEFHLTGILSDTYADKKYGVLNLYSPMDKEITDSYLAYVLFQDSVNYNDKVKSLKTELGINRKQIKECPARENLRELYWTDIEISSIILLICLVVFYGVYRIATLSRVQQYGILRAIGMKRKQFYKMLLLELHQIYLVSVPVGLVSGLLISSLVMLISGDRKTEVYLFNETVRFRLIIPIYPLFISVFITFILVSILGYMMGRKITGSSVIETISGKATEKENSVFPIQQTDGKTGTLFRMSGKYIFKDLKTSGFVILTISLGIVLFTGLAYKANTLKIYRKDTKEMHYLNGDYALTMLSFQQVNEGLSRQSVEKIRNTEGIVSVKTSSGLPIRVLDEDGIKRNDAYYDEYNEKLKEVYGYEKSGYDGNNQVYQSMLLGYNEGAIKELQKYVVEGDFNPEDIGKDKVILSVCRMDNTKNNDLPGYYKEGTPLMEYHAGDKISIKYREDLQTDSEEYAKMKDSNAAYIYKTYEIAAIVSFPFMYDCMHTVYPKLITNDSYIQELAPESGIQCMYCEGKKNMDISQQNLLEQHLIQIGSKNQNISTRSLIDETKQNEMFYHKQMVYIYGISIIAFILVMINMINNLRYRMQKRTKEICMLRAIGMSVAMTKRMMLFENLILGIVSVLVALLLSHPVLKYLYKISDMKAFSHTFQFAYTDFLLVAAAALAICGFLSLGILKSWKTRQITERIGSFE